MAKKRTSLDALFQEDTAALGSDQQLQQPQSTGQQPGRRPSVKQQTAYLPLPVYHQLRRLAVEEDRKMHSYLLEGLDRVFADRGIPSIDELTRTQ